MAQLIQRGPSAAGSFGAGLGQGLQSLGTGLQNLADLKLQQMMQQQQQGQIAKGLEALGFNPEQATQLAFLPPESRQELIKQKLLEPSQEAYARALGLEPEEPEVPTQVQNIDQLLGEPYQARTGLDLLKSGKQPEILEPLTEQGKKLTAGQQIEKRKAAGLKIPARLTEKQATEIAKFKQKEKFQEQKFSQREQEISDKESKPIYDEIRKEDKAAKQNDLRLNRIEELVNRGNLNSPAFATILKSLSHGIAGLGIDLNFLLTADSAELDKLSTDFLKSAKDTFGSRLTNYDVQTFLKTVPTLVQTDAGKLRIINNLRAFNEASHLRAKAMDDIIKENGGRRPRHLDALVEERIQPDLDELAMKFKSGYGGNPESPTGSPSNLLKFLHNQAVSLGASGGLQKPIL